MPHRPITFALVLLTLPLAATPAFAALSAGPAVAPAEAVPVPDILDLTGALDESVPVAPEHLPQPGLAQQIGPGSWLLIRMGSSTYGCTANFIWASPTKLYLGAAGHCFVPPGKTATHGPSPDHDAAATSVRACFSNCVHGGQSGFVITGTTVQLGPLAYARSSQAGVAVGNDFGIVEIPAGVAVRAEMPIWGGPVGSGYAGVGQLVCFYGNGVAYGEAYPTKARMGAGALTNLAAGSYTTVAPTSSGDSGMAVVRCVTHEGGVHGVEAVGIHTHSVVVTAVPGLRYGTTIAKAQSMATQAGISISLVSAS